MIKVTRKQMVAAQNALNTLSNVKVALPVAYRINKLIGFVVEALQETEKIRIDIVKKYAPLDEDGNIISNDEGQTVQIPPDKIDALNHEMNLLYEEEYEILGEPIKLSLLNDINITSQEISTLEPFLTEE